jgi:drug/metabolite transporter (DMT)-like permease
VNGNARTWSYAALGVAIMCWGTSALFIRMLRLDLDPFTITFVRFSIALIPLLILTLTLHRKDFLRLIRIPRVMIALASVNILQQTSWTNACVGMEAATAQFGVELSVVLVIIAGYFMYHEERAVIRSPLFMVGAVVCIAGLAGVLTSNPASLLPVLDRYAVFLMVCAACWAAYSVWVKHLVRDIHPIPLFTTVVLFTVVGYVPLLIGFGDVSRLMASDSRVWFVLVLSGTTPLVLGHPLFYFAQKHLGVSFSATMSLMTPLCALLYAFLFFPDERLLPRQVISGFVLVFGALLVTLAQLRAARVGQPVVMHEAVSEA